MRFLPSVSFGFAHFDGYLFGVQGMVLAFGFGLVAAALFEVSGSLAPALILHLCADAVSVFLLL